MITLTILAIIALGYVMNPPIRENHNGINVGEFYYIKSINRIVYIDSFEGGDLILRGGCNFLDDAKTTIVRQRIDLKSFYRNGPVKIDALKPEQCAWINKDNIISCWSVKDDRGYRTDLIGCQPHSWAWELSPIVIW